ncbi:MAG: hypothetical protein WB780_17625 [Candidatus Acidiferrales bacterium]
MMPGARSVTRFLQPLSLILLLALIPSMASAQEKKPPAPKPAPAAKPAPAPKPAPAEKPPKDDRGEPAGKPAAKPGTNSRTTAGTSGGNRSNNTATTNRRMGTNTAANRPNAGANGTNRAANNRNNPGAPAPSREVNATTVKVITPNATTGKTAGNSNAARTTSPAANKNFERAGFAKGGSSNSAHANNQPGTHPLPNGGTRTVKANGTAVERNKAGKVTAVTTSKGTTVKMDAHGHAAAIHDAHGTTIFRGPHGQRRVETVRRDHSRLVSTGRHAGFAEQRFSRDGHEYVLRSYFDHGHLFARIYRPYFYGGYPYYAYVPPFYFGIAYYGWAYNAWAVPVNFAWGWDAAPWYAPYGYYFAPYGIYPAPAPWLTDYAIAASLQAGAEDSDVEAAPDAGSAPSQLESAPAPESPDGQQTDGGSAVMTRDLKDQIAKQVKVTIADEKAAAAAQGNLPPDDDSDGPVPPSLDPRLTLFIASSSLSLDTGDGACAVTAGDIIKRSENKTDADGTVAITVVSSKKADCAVGTASRMAVDDLEEMHDSFRQKIDDGLKSLADSQGKGGIPNGPKAIPHNDPDGKADPDPTVEADLKKQQEAANATEAEVQQAALSEGGSAD